MEEHLYHYYDESTGPFRNLSDMEPYEAARILDSVANGLRVNVLRITW